MEVKELYNFYNEKIPSSLTEEEDHDGLLCCPSPDKEVKSAIFALDITDDVIEQAIKKDAQVIISHHPIIYKGIGEINSDNFIGSKIINLIKNDIAAFSFHTRLDAVCGGVNDTLCFILGIDKVSPFGGDSGSLGREGYLPKQMTVEDFAQLVKEKLCCDRISFSDCGKRVSHIAVLGGKGSDYIRDAISLGADTFLSGEFGYHNINDSKDFGINLIEAGHFFTENPVCKKLSEIAMKADPKIHCEIVSSYTVKTI